MDWLKSIWNKHLFGKDIPWANIKHQADGSITISDFNHAFVKSVTEKLPLSSYIILGASPNLVKFSMIKSMK